MFEQKKMASSPNEIPMNFSIECIDSCDGSRGVVVYADKTFPISSRQAATQETAAGHGRVTHSSVRVFQWPVNHVAINMEQGPPETAGDSRASLEEEVAEEE